MKKSIKEVRNENRDWLMDIENVNGLAINHYYNGREFLTVYVKEITHNIEKKVPKKLEGYNVEIRETGEIRAE